MFIVSWKNYLCLSKFKCFPMSTLPPPKSPSNQSQNSSKTLIKNFNSLYDQNSAAADDLFSSSSDYNSSDADSPPDVATVFASQRFFFSSPGCSNSIFQSPNSNSMPAANDSALVPGSVAIQTYSPDPFVDFRESMKEMVEAREFTDVKADWDFLHELLLCYLTLNPKHTHKLILKAFSDLLISIISSTTTDTSRKIEDPNHCTASSHNGDWFKQFLISQGK